MNFLVTAFAIGTINSNVALNNQVSTKVKDHNDMVQEKIEEGIKYFNDHLEEGKEYLKDHSEEGKEYFEDHLEEGKEYLEKHAEEGKEYFEEIDLTQDTIEANSRFFDSMDEVPKRAITMGIGEIMKAKEIILMATGKNKAKAIKGLLSGKVTTKNPATLLQLHQNVTIVIDEEINNLIK